MTETTAAAPAGQAPDTDQTALLDRIAELESVLRCLASPEPCDWQSDYCRTHGWKSDLGTCPHSKAQALLATGEHR